MATSTTPNDPAALRITRHFTALKDPRVTGRTSHPLLNILVMALVGVICGANGWDEIVDIAEDRKDWFEGFLAMPHGIPSADTFRRVLSAIRPTVFADCVRSWVESLAEPLDGQVVAFDGKTIRGALKRNRLGTALHQVHVWSCQPRLLLAQVGVRGAAEESEVVRCLLSLVCLRGAIATGDAAHCSAKTARSILDTGADYLLHLKGNQKAMHAAVRSFFAAARDTKFQGLDVRHVRKKTRGHGRSEIREAWSVRAQAIALRGKRWPDLRSVTLIERTRLVGEKQTTEQHYYLSSLAPKVRRIEAAAREHWSVENNLHWVLDVQMNEDECGIYSDSGAQNFGMLRRISLMMLQRETSFVEFPERLDV